ncbi:MAG TPA: RsmB/NOP family class I SAM-dependent RNA methyltransferase [Planctomycetota bacterium]|nr:RsmB/NOP family class I SAM-dependent RNA methyltransferase [Planctomycetota bacterium]
MQTSSLLGHAQEACAMILARPQPADLLLREFFRARKYLGAKDRRFIADTTYALLRWKLQLDEIAARVPAPFAARPAARAVALAARGKIRAEVDELAEAAATLLRVGGKDMAAFARSAADVRGHGGEAREIAFDESFPLWMVERFVARFGAADARRLAAALNEPAPTTLRANTLKNTRDELLAALAADDIGAKPTPLAPDGVVLTKRINVFDSKAFRDGKFEMQDEGSQLVSVALDPHPDWRVLDACAGAGGKTLHVAALMRGRGEVFAYEPDERRRGELKRRVRRSGAQNVRIVESPEKLPGGMDAVLVDAPCSGTGTIRRNPMIKNRLAPEDLARHQAEQLAILSQWAPQAKPGGIIAYATCSLLEEENEQVVAAFLAGSGCAPRATAAPFGALPCTLLPHVHGTDGFFLAHATAGAPR